MDNKTKNKRTNVTLVKEPQWKNTEHQTQRNDCKWKQKEKTDYWGVRSNETGIAMKAGS